MYLKYDSSTVYITVKIYIYIFCMILKEFYCTIKVVNYSKKHCDIAQFKIIIYFNIFEM